MSITTVTCTAADAPSRSKGWARYMLLDAEGKAIETLTSQGQPTRGEWLSPTPGTRTLTVPVEGPITVRIEVELVEGKAKKKTRYTTTETVVSAGKVSYRPGSQGIAIHFG